MDMSNRRVRSAAGGSDGLSLVIVDRWRVQDVVKLPIEENLDGLDIRGEVGVAEEVGEKGVRMAEVPVPTGPAVGTGEFLGCPGQHLRWHGWWKRQYACPIGTTRRRWITEVKGRGGLFMGVTCIGIVLLLS